MFVGMNAQDFAVRDSDAVAKGYVLYSLAQYNDGKSFVALWAKPSTNVKKHKYCIGCSFDWLEVLMVEYELEGFYLTDISGRNLGQVPKGSLTAIVHYTGNVATTPRSRHSFNMNRDQFDQRNAAARQDGMVLVSASFNNKVSFNAIWHEAPSGLQWSAFVGTADEFIVERSNALHSGRHLAFQDVSPDGTTVLAVFRDDVAAAGDWESAIELTTRGLGNYWRTVAQGDYARAGRLVTSIRGRDTGIFSVIMQQKCIGDYCT